MDKIIDCPWCGANLEDALEAERAELAAWRAEAMAAREIFQVLQGHIEYTHKITEDKVNELYPAYLAARVKEGE